MSWINSDATKKQSSKNDLSFYHGFSKTPVEPTSNGTAATTLANASTKGGHTVIGTEVWAEEIPWFGLVASRAAAVTRLSGLTKLNDLVKVDGEGGKVYKYKGADDATFTEDTWADFWEEVTLTNGMTLNNRHNQPVLRYYLNQPMQTLTTTNNASIDSKGYATRLFVNEENHTGQTSGGSVVSQFAAGTDNIKNGIPSVELNPKLYLGTTEKIAGTHYYDYNVSGTILWSTAVTSSSPKISCFRYIGKSVSAKTAEIEKSIEDLTIAAGAGITVTDGTKSKNGVTTLTLGGENGVTVTVNETTGAVTFGVDTATIATTASVTAISDRISAAASDITANSEKLVTGKAVYDYVSGATLTSADDAIQSATGDDANKLVTAAQVKEYVEKNAQVTLTVGETEVTSTGFEFAGSTGDDVTVAAEMDANGKVTYSATLSKATVDATTGAITNNSGALAVSATDAQKIATAVAQAEIEAAVEEGEIIDSRISDVLSANTAALNTDNTIKSGDESKFVTASDADKLADKAITDSLAGDGDGTIGKAISDAVGAIVIPGVEASDPTKGLGFDVGTNPNTSSHYIHLATATYTPATGETDAYWDRQGYLVTGSTVETFVGAEVGKVATDLATLENKVNAYHKAGVSYKVYTSTPLPDLSIEANVVEYKNVILLVPKNPDSSYNPPSAISGDYTEYLCVNKGTEEAPQWTWEQIGTTAADLEDYVQCIQVNGKNLTNKKDGGSIPGYLELGSFASTVASGQATTLANQSSVYANIATNGTLTLGVADASTTGKGLVQLAADVASDSTTGVTTAAAVKAYADTKVSSVTAGSGDALTGLSVSVDNTDTTAPTISVTNGVINSGSLPATAKVVANGLVDGTDVIETEKINFGEGLPENALRFISYHPTTQLTTWVGDMPNLQSGYNMFSSCITLESFCGDLSAMTYGDSMFSGCNNLTSFTSDLSSLTTGYSMFSGCKLDVESVECIADTINEHEGLINISWSKLPAEDKRQELVDELSRIVDKGWTLNTNPELLSLFDSEKYQTGETTVQPLDLESEPQTVYYVIKK